MTFTVLDSCNLLNDPTVIQALEYVAFVSKQWSGAGETIRSKVGKRCKSIVDKTARKRLEDILRGTHAGAPPVAPFPPDVHLIDEFPICEFSHVSSKTKK